MTTSTQNQFNRAAIKRKAIERIICDGVKHAPLDYIKNWFDADSFFETTYATGLIRGRYFVTADQWTEDRTIYAAKMITSSGIETLPNSDGDRALNSLEEAKAVIKAHYQAIYEKAKDNA